MPSKSAALDGVAVAHLVVPFAIKADAIDSGARTFEGLASVWGLDLGDDVMHKGAFKDTLAEWKKAGDAIPLLNSHNHFDITSAVGQMLDAKETNDGLWTKWEVIDGADGDAVLARLRPSLRTGKAAVSKMSIGYEPAKFDMEENDKARFGMVRNLRKVNLKEVSLVIFPMAPGARIDVQSVKSLSADAVRAFIADLAATDRDTLNDDVKLELRRANTRIGFLISSKKTTPTIAETPTPSPESPAPTPTDPAPTAPAPVTAEDTPTPDAKAEPTYDFPEALQHRLQRIRTHSVLNNTGTVQ